MFSLADTNPTQISGVLAFAAAAGACAWAARRTRERAAVPWRWLAVANAGFTAEIVLGLRHEVHGAVDALLQANGWYAQREPLQQGLLVVALLAGGAGLVALLRACRSQRAAAPAVLASGVVGALFALELISLHAIDALLYRRIGPLMLIALLWAACAAVVVRAGLRAAAAAAASGGAATASRGASAPSATRPR
jgi:hypothetical protein